jgi:hypothetical protein
MAEHTEPQVPADSSSLATNNATLRDGRPLRLELGFSFPKTQSDTAAMRQSSKNFAMKTPATFAARERGPLKNPSLLVGERVLAFGGVSVKQVQGIVVRDRRVSSQAATRRPSLSVFHFMMSMVLFSLHRLFLSSLVVVHH